MNRLRELLRRHWLPPRPLGLGDSLAAGAATFVVLAALVLARRFFAWTLHPEGTRAYSPIMLFQGAPRSHYEAEHFLATGLHDALGGLPGWIAASLAAVALGMVWRRLHERWSHWSLRLLTSIVFVEIGLLGPAILFSAGSAYHHVGWGMPCRSQLPTDLLLVHGLAFVALAIPVVAAAWRRKGEGPLRLFGTLTTPCSFAVE